MKILHIGDLHLGGKYPEKAAVSIDWILAKIEDPNSPAHRPDLVVCTGDSTEKPLHVHSESLQPLLKLVNTVQCPMVFLQGTPSHEPYGFLNNLETATQQRITVIDRPNLIIGKLNDFTCRGTASDQEIAIATLPALNKPILTKWGGELGIGLPSDDPAEIIRSIMLWIATQWKDFAGPKILLGHWTVTGCATASGQTLFASDLAVGLDDIALAGADAVLLGHIHRAQKWDSPVLTAYCGSAYPCNWGELDPKSFNVVTFNDRGSCGIQAVPYPHKPMAKIDVTFTGQMDNGEWQYNVAAESLSGANLDSLEIKVVYTVPKEIAAQVDDMYVRVLFKKLGIDLAAIDRVMQATGRERIADIGNKETARDQYAAVCEIKGETPRPGALIKADQIDEQVVAP